MTALDLYRKYEVLNYLAVKYTSRHAEAVGSKNLPEYSYFTAL